MGEKNNVLGKKNKKNSCSHGWMCEVLREKIKGCTLGKEGTGRRAQLEDLLIALAERRSFPETRFFVARGIVGDTWSTESVGAAVFPASVLVLLVKDPGKKKKKKKMEGGFADGK